MRGERGVTLMELLIAITLVSALALGMLFALRIGLNALGKSNAKITANRKAFGARRVLEQEINGILLANADCRANEFGVQKRPFFQGEPDAMRFVSTFSLQQGSRGPAMLLEYKVIPGQDGTGVRLVVNEHAYAGAGALGSFCLGMGIDPVTQQQIPLFPPIQISPDSFVLADRLAYCRLRYQDIQPEPLGERWLTRWTKPTLPTAIRIEMLPLQVDASRLQLITLTAPIRVNRNPELNYVD